MPGPILVQYHLTAEDYALAVELYSDHAQGAGPRRRGIFPLAASLGGIFLVIVWASARRLRNGLAPGPEVFGLLVIMTVSFTYFAFFRKADERRSRRREFTSLPPSMRDCHLSYSIDETGVVYSSPSGRIEYPWAQVTKVIDSDDGFVVVIEDYEYLWFPRASFSSPDEAARFADLARARVDSYQMVASA